jgi:hypothetical protein
MPRSDTFAWPSFAGLFEVPDADGANWGSVFSVRSTDTAAVCSNAAAVSVTMGLGASKSGLAMREQVDHLAGHRDGVQRLRRSERLGPAQRYGVHRPLQMFHTLPERTRPLRGVAQHAVLDQRRLDVRAADIPADHALRPRHAHPPGAR